jgi:hypothetical protein
VRFETTLERLRAILGPCERGKRGGWDVAVTGKGTFRNVADVENAAANVSRTSLARMVSDIDYFYASRLPGEPADGVEDIHTHPALPRSARIGIQFSF